VNWDDIVLNPVCELPNVIQKKQAEKLPDFYTNLGGHHSAFPYPERGSANVDDNEDSGFLDSGYEVEDGDDDLFVDHIDEDVEDEEN
jgi:hypothetical protein